MSTHGRNDGAMMLTSDDTKLFEPFYPLNGLTWRCLAGNGGGIGLLTNCAEIKKYGEETMDLFLL